MSPEQARGEEVDQRSDIFSFGALMYEMITGRRPFKGEHEAAIMYSLMNETPEPLARYKTNVPDELQRVVDKALSKDRSERYQHIDEMTADLRRAQHGISGSVTSTKKKSKVPWIVTAIVLVATIVGIYLFYPKSAPTTTISKSIAVLPFKNMSDSKEDEYFSDGLTEDIITQLSKISGIEKVIARTSVMRYKETEKSIRDIGKELDVATVLEGSVRRAGNQIRIVAQLIDVQNEGHLWADTYDKEMTQVFAIQSDVAQQIATALEAKMSPAVKNSIEKKQTENTEAYQLYLKGRFYWNKRTVPDLQKSIEYFNQAIVKDQNYTLAYAGLANSYVILPAFGLSTEEYYQKAKEAATKALEFDSTLAEVHTVLALIKESHYDWTNAERIYKRAIELNPGYPTAHQWYGGLLNTLGRFDEAFTEASRAVELDPLSLIINYSLSRTLLYMRQYKQAIDQCNKGVELDPNFPWSYSVRGAAAEAQGKFDEAINDYQKARLLSHSDPSATGDIGGVYARTGRKDDALKVLRELTEYSKQGYLVSYYMAYVYYRLGDKERTFELLERSIHDYDASVMDMSSNPSWDDLRSDPRFVALLKKVGLRK
jgi:TolB-like protein